jgi:hypothetical protein
MWTAPPGQFAMSKNEPRFQAQIVRDHLCTKTITEMGVSQTIFRGVGRWKLEFF